MPTTHTVDCSKGEKIQDAIAAAQPGDTILVSGNCAENVRVPVEVARITLDGAEGAKGMDGSCVDRLT